MINKSKMQLVSIVLCILLMATMFQLDFSAVYANPDPMTLTGPEKGESTNSLYEINPDTLLNVAEPDSEAPVLSTGYFGPSIAHPWIAAENLGSGGAPNKVHAYFTIDGTNPTEASAEVTIMSYYGMVFTFLPQNPPFPKVPTQLKAVVYLDGGEGEAPLISAVGTKVFNLEAPIPSKTSGLYETSDLSEGITLYSVRNDVTVYYTTGTGVYFNTYGTADDTGVPEPSEAGVMYNGEPIEVAETDNENCFIIKAASRYSENGKDLWSDVVTVYYRSRDELPKLTKNNIDEIVNALSLEERIALTSGIGGDPTTLLNGKNIPDEIGFSTAPDRYELDKKVQGGGPAGGTLAIPRFNIPAMVLADGPAGVRMWKNATVWMAPAGLGSTWNSDIAEAVGARVAEEARYYAVDIVLGPGLNTQRNPLAGRNFEYYSEDPYLSGYAAAAYIKAIQNGGVGVSLKHFAANDSESNRSQGDVVVSERALREIYLRGFEMAAAEKPWTYMAAYNKVNGTLAASDKWLMTDVLRGDWGFDGFVMSDWGADYVPSESLEAQMDLGESSRDKAAVLKWINEDGITSAEKMRRVECLNRSVKNILGVLVRSSAFNGVYGELLPDGTYSGLKQEDVSQRSNTWAVSSVRNASAAVNKQAADEAVVMLKNANGALPLDEGAKLALVTSHLAWNEKYHGRWYNNSASVGDIVIQGTGSAQVRFNHGNYYSLNLEDALKDRGFAVVDHRMESKMDITYEELVALNRRVGDRIPPQAGQIESLPVTTNAENTAAAAEAAAETADVGVFVLTRVSGEGADLAPADFNLTDREKMIFKAYADAFHAKDKKIVVLLNVGGTVNTTEFRADADAILDVWNPGTEGTVAIADILKGAVNPSGKLAQTFPQTYDDSPSIAMAKPGHEGKTFNSSPTVYYDDGVYVGYRYYETNPEKYAEMVAYPFGYGLSYTTFEFGNFNLDKTDFVTDNDKVKATVKVTNTGKVPGKEVVQLYLNADTWEEENRPRQELKAFGKTSLLQPGQSEEVSLTLSLRDLQYFDDGNPDNDLTDVKYDGGNGWTVKDNTVFTATVRTNAETTDMPNTAIEGLTKTFTYHKPEAPASSSSHRSVTQVITMIPEENTTKTIHDAVADGKIPVITIDGAYVGGSFAGEALIGNGKEGSDIDIKNGKFKVSLSPQLMKEWELTNASDVDVIFTESINQIGTGLTKKLKEINAVNGELCKNVYSLNIKKDGKTVTDTVDPMKVSADVSNLADGQKTGLTGVCYTSSGDYKQLGGELSADGDTFIFYTYHTGTLGIVFSDNILKMQFTINDTEYTKNGSKLKNDVAPFISAENRTMIPVRVAAEALGAQVDWTAETYTVTISEEGKAVKIEIGKPLPDGLGTAVIVDGRTFVPLRYVLEKLGANVVWDGTKRTVTIYQ